MPDPKARPKSIMDYYMTANLYEPPDIHQREFGVIKQGRGMWRHLAFPNISKLRGFLIEQQPDHVYSSSAKYKDPGNPTMAEKDWLGADLIFDIDYDHLHDPTLGEAAWHTKKLWGILWRDFGLKDMMGVFSGARGYHVHVRDDCVQDLDNACRREIADYFMEFYLDSDKRNPNYVGIDVPITSDTHRLIRLPGSIHGKTGRKCDIIKIENGG